MLEYNSDNALFCSLSLSRHLCFSLQPPTQKGVHLPNVVGQYPYRPLKRYRDISWNNIHHIQKRCLHQNTIYHYIITIQLYHYIITIYHSITVYHNLSQYSSDKHVCTYWHFKKQMFTSWQVVSRPSSDDYFSLLLLPQSLNTFSRVRRASSPTVR